MIPVGPKIGFPMTRSMYMSRDRRNLVLQEKSGLRSYRPGLKNWPVQSLQKAYVKTAQLISVFVFITRIVPFLCYLYTKFEDLAFFCDSMDRSVSDLV